MHVGQLWACQRNCGLLTTTQAPKCFNPWFSPPSSISWLVFLSTKLEPRFCLSYRLSITLYLVFWTSLGYKEQKQMWKVTWTLWGWGACTGKWALLFLKKYWSSVSHMFLYPARELRITDSLCVGQCGERLCVRGTPSLLIKSWESVRDLHCQLGSLLATVVCFENYTRYFCAGKDKKLSPMENYTFFPDRHC